MKACPWTGSAADQRADQRAAKLPLRWEYDCACCGLRFEVPVPKGPAQERALRCTRCGNAQIRRVNRYVLSDAFCGG